MRPAAMLCNYNRQSCGEIMDIRGRSSSVTENRPSSKNVMKIKILSSSHSLCSESSMCIAKYHESLANGSFFVIKLGQVWRQVIKDNWSA